MPLSPKINCSWPALVWHKEFFIPQRFPLGSSVHAKVSKKQANTFLCVHRIDQNFSLLRSKKKFTFLCTHVLQSPVPKNAFSLVSMVSI